MNGIILINKERGYTSRDIVNIVSKILNTKKIGHTGTLDPMAEGLLILTVGKCTKLCDYLTSEYKEYIAEFKLGYLTDTLDDTGNIIKRSNKIVQKDEIINIINSYKKEYFQTVPIYSAIKVNGKKLYEYARNNIDIELPKRKVIIKDIDILNIGETIKIKCLVSKGTYIRSLIDDIGKSLGTYATMTKLVRIRQGNYIIDNSYTIEDIKNNNFKIITIEEIFNEAERINIDNELYQRVINGNILDNIYNNEYVLFFYKNKLISVYKEYEKSKIKPLIML